jgi:hypothetical protein
MPLTHQDNGVSMGGTLKDVLTQKNCYITAGSKGLLNLHLLLGFGKFLFIPNRRSYPSKKKRFGAK